MGSFAYETYDPDDLELPNDTDFVYEGIDEAYETYQEYQVYLPDMIGDMRPLSDNARAACDAAEQELRRLRQWCASHAVVVPLAQLLLCDEAVSTAQIENYRVDCRSLLEFLALPQGSVSRMEHDAEATAAGAAEALRCFAMSPGRTLSVSDICETNGLFAWTSPRAEFCGRLRERPVFIGGSLFDADYVPPPADALGDYLDDLVRFMNAETDDMGPVAKAAIASVQFVNVHPFEDGNGRTSRAIAQRVLQQAGACAGLVLPVSAAMEVQKPRYFDAVAQARSDRGPSDPSMYVTFFAECCVGAARQAMALGSRIEKVLEGWMGRLGQVDDGALGVLETIASVPVMDDAMLSSALGAGAQLVVGDLVEKGILQRRASGFGGADVYVATDVLRLLDAAQRMCDLGGV